MFVLANFISNRFFYLSEEKFKIYSCEVCEPSLCLFKSRGSKFKFFKNKNLSRMGFLEYDALPFESIIHLSLICLCNGAGAWKPLGRPYNDAALLSHFRGFMMNRE